MDRRHTILGLLALGAAPHTAKAQQAAKVARIGYLSPNLSANPELRVAFRQGLRDLGYVEGRNVVIEFRDGEGSRDRLVASAAELVALKVDVIVTEGGTLGASVGKRATTTIPVIFASGDPVGSGLVASLARPGGNLTGLSTIGPELIGKRLELLKQALPGVDRVAVLRQPIALGERVAEEMVRAADAAARALGMRPQIVDARDENDLERAFSDMASARVNAVVLLPANMFLREHRRVVELAAKHRLPAAYSSREFADDGGLMSYGPSQADLYRRAATYADRILKGARPGDLPIEYPTKFELVINLKTAKSLGLTIPPSVLALADDVIK
jgi:putative ABC transport system substrate-binding protein